MRAHALTHRFLQTVFILAACIALFGCSKDKDDDRGTGPTVRVFPEDLIGAWRFDSGTVNGATTAICSPAFMDCHDETVVVRLQFRADFSVTYRERDSNGDVLNRMDGTVSVDGSNLTIRFTEVNLQDATPVTFRGSYEVLLEGEANRYTWADDAGNTFEVWTSR